MSPTMRRFLESATPDGVIDATGRDHWQTRHTATERGWVVRDQWRQNRYHLTEKGRDALTR